MDNKVNFLFITHVEKEGPFLKVWGQVDKATAINVEQALLKTTPHFEQGFFTLTAENLQNGVLCCAKYKDNKYYRARIVSTDQVQNGYVEVNFLDFGNRDVVPCISVKSMQNFTSSFISLPPLANSFLLAEAVCATGEWNDVCFQEIVKEIKYAEVNYIVVAQAVKYYYVRLLMNGQDLAHNFINRGLMARTSLHTQEAVLLTMMSKQSSPAPTTASMQPPQTILTYKAFTLDPGSQHPVYVSYISDGPCHFSVQLKQTEDILVKLMNDINSMPLKPLEDCPLPGTVCVARCIEDGHICRAVVTNEVDSQFKVFYVDFGNSEIVPLEALYQIPFKYVIPKVMAIRFALNGVEKSTLTLEMKCAFKQFVDNRLLMMKVIPCPQRTALPKCELYDPQTNTSALDVLHRAAVNAYPEPLALNRGFSQPVRVSYVFSCNRFYVQLKSKENELAQLMMDLQESCQMNDPMHPDSIKEGLPCCALFEGDGQWYRSQIVEVCGDDTVKVRYIDYGNEEMVPITMLKLVDGEQLTVLRPQAIECCLNGYQNMAADQERDNFLEEIILEKEFTMKVVEMQSGKALVELIDTSNYNVASLLLEKIANARSQVSPMLIQAGNRIEHRKSLTSPTQNFRDFKDRRIGRDSNKNWNEKTNDSTSWRQENKDNKPFRNRDTNDQPTDWRQNRDNRDNNFNRGRQNDKTDDRSSNKGFRGKSFSSPAEDNWGGDSAPVNDKNYNSASPAEGTWNDNASEAKDTNNWDGNSNRTGGFRKKDNTWGDDANKDNDEKPYGYRGRNNDKNKNNQWSGGDSNKKEWDNKSTDSYGSASKGDKPRGDNWNKDRGGRNKADGDWHDNKGRGGRFGDRDNRWEKGSDKSGGDWSDKGDSRGGGKRFEKNSWDKGGDKGDWGDGGGKKGFEKKPWDKDKKQWDKGSDKGDNWSDGGKGGKWDKGDRPPRRENRFDNQKSSWDAESPKSGGQGFKKNFHRENSELSSSGSERGFHKDRKPGKFDSGYKKFDKPMKSSGSQQNSWEVSESFDAAPSTALFASVEVNLGTEAKVTISWFHNPAHFYVHLSEYENQLRTMMEDIQLAYKCRKPSSAVLNAPVISIFPEDKVLYRAKVLEVSGSSYKVFYVDFGNVATVDKVWPIETKFMDLPAQAVCCGLYGIGPLNEHWEEASAYSLYFDKESFICRFVENNKGRYLVEMTFGECSVSTLLETDGLAKSTLQPACPVLLELMRCQQFWATVKSINSLGDILIQTLRDDLLQCSVFNLDQAQETHIQNLQQYLNLNVIVDVHDINNETLIVTFYEWENGNKIDLVEPDPGTYSHFPTLLSHPVVHENIYGVISCVDGDVIYITPSNYLDELKAFEDSLATHYESLPQDTAAMTPAKDFLYALKDENSVWHRVMALEDATEDVTSIKVQFVDSDKIEEVACKDLRELTPEFIRVARFCFPVSVKEMGEMFTKAEGTFVMVGGIKPKKGRDDTVFEAVSVEDCAPPQAAYEEIQIDENQILVSITHVESPNEFYIQKYEDTDPINEIQARLQTDAESMEVLENAAVGMLCAALYSEDEQWYRAEILEVNPDTMIVRFVDYGNTDTLTNETMKVKALPSDMLSLPAYATRSSFKVAPIEEVWNPEAAELLNSFVDAENVTAMFIDQDELTTYFELYVNGESVREMLVSKNLAVDIAIPDQEGVAQFQIDDSHLLVSISHVDTPNEFYIQKSEDVDFINEIQARLQTEVETMQVLENPAAGVLCAAPYSLDEQWYRAEVLDADSDITTVRFVDYGNTDVLSNDSVKIRALPPDMLSMAVHATRSSLKAMPVDEEWSPDAIEVLNNLVDAENVTAKFIDQDEKLNYVELFVNGESVREMLISKNLAVDCARPVEEGNTGFVSHINSPSEFFIQLECYASELERFSEQLSERDAENFPELEDLSPGSLCAAMYLDEQWYRARILSNTVAGVEVLFIDFGNSSVSSNLRQLPEDLVVPPPLAQKCSLKKPEGLIYWSPQAVEKFNEISADGQTIFTVEKLSNGETSMVRLLLDGEDIVNQLLPETVDGQLQNVKSLDSFEVVANGETSTTVRLEPVPGYVWNEEAFGQFIEIDNNGQTIFQIEYVSEDTVRLYINSRDIRADLSTTKQVSHINESLEETDTNEELYTDQNLETYEQVTDDQLLKPVDSDISGSFIVNPDEHCSDSNTSAKDTTLEISDPESIIATQKKTEDDQDKEPESDTCQYNPETETNISEECDNTIDSNSDNVMPPKEEVVVEESQQVCDNDVREGETVRAEAPSESPREDLGSPEGSPVKSTEPQSTCQSPPKVSEEEPTSTSTPEVVERELEVEGDSAASTVAKSPELQSRSESPSSSDNKAELSDSKSPLGSAGSSPVKAPQPESKSESLEASPNKAELSSSPAGSAEGSPVKTKSPEASPTKAELSSSSAGSAGGSPVKSESPEASLSKAQLSGSPIGSAGDSPVKSESPEASPNKAQLSGSPIGSAGGSPVKSSSPARSAESSPVTFPEPQNKSESPQKEPESLPEKKPDELIETSQNSVHMNGESTEIDSAGDAKQKDGDESKSDIKSDMVSIIDKIVDGFTDDPEQKSLKTKNVDEQEESQSPVGDSGEKASDIRNE